MTRRMHKEGNVEPKCMKTQTHWERHCDMYDTPYGFLVRIWYGCYGWGGLYIGRASFAVSITHLVMFHIILERV